MSGLTAHPGQIWLAVEPVDSGGGLAAFIGVATRAFTGLMNTSQAHCL